MAKFILRRVLLMVPTLVAVSMLSFLIIQAPPGDYVDTYVQGLQRLGQIVEQGQVDALRARYGLDDPVYVQYLKWAGHLLRGDLGRSFAWNQPVKTLLFERLPWTILIAFSSLLIVYILAIPIGTTSAINQYSARDYLFTAVGFLGLAIPNSEPLPVTGRRCGVPAGHAGGRSGSPRPRAGRGGSPAPPGAGSVTLE